MSNTQTVFRRHVRNVLVSTRVDRGAIHLMLDMFLDLVGTSRGGLGGAREINQGVPKKRGNDTRKRKRRRKKTKVFLFRT